MNPVIVYTSRSVVDSAVSMLRPGSPLVNLAIAIWKMIARIQVQHLPESNRLIAIFLVTEQCVTALASHVQGWQR